MPGLYGSVGAAAEAGGGTGGFCVHRRDIARHEAHARVAARRHQVRPQLAAAHAPVAAPHTHLSTPRTGGQYLTLGGTSARRQDAA